MAYLRRLNYSDFLTFQDSIDDIYKAFDSINRCYFFLWSSEPLSDDEFSNHIISLNYKLLLGTLKKHALCKTHLSEQSYSYFGCRLYDAHILIERYLVQYCIKMRNESIYENHKKDFIINLYSDISLYFETVSENEILVIFDDFFEEMYAEILSFYEDVRRKDADAIFNDLDCHGFLLWENIDQTKAYLNRIISSSNQPVTSVDRYLKFKEKEKLL